MAKLHPLLCSLVLVLFSQSVYAQQRTLLYPNPNSLSGPIQEFAKIIRDPGSDEVPVDRLPLPSRYFVRIVPRRYVLTNENKIVDAAVLAVQTKPFVFLTTPESVFGRSLLEIYADIGYEAEDIIRWQRNEDMVAILFRYPDNVLVSDIRNGNLETDWSQRIYRTTWDNLLSVFTRLVRNERTAPCKETDMPAKSICLPPKQSAFVLRFPLAGKRQLKTKSYSTLRALGGPTWEYRELLENKLSVFEHFRGDGRTENELLEFPNKPTQPRLMEVIGPNIRINDLPEVAIIHLGKLIIEDSYSPRKD
jgi:hypothetical protein